MFHIPQRNTYNIFVKKSLSAFDPDGGLVYGLTLLCTLILPNYHLF